MAPHQRPKPAPIADTAEKRYAKWVDRQLTEALGDHASLSDAIAAGADLTAINAAITALQTSVADHETRIDDLEAADTAFRTTPFSGGYILTATIVATNYYPPIGLRPSNLPNSTLNVAQLAIGRDGTFKNLRARVLTATADTDTFTIGINVNGSSTALVTPTTTGTSTAWVEDTTTNLTVSKGDLYCIEIKIVSGNQSQHTLLWTYDFVEAA